MKNWQMKGIRLDVGCPWQGVGNICEKRPGQPCARHRRFQPVPTDPLQGTAEPSSHLPRIFKKGKKVPGRERKREQKE